MIKMVVSDVDGTIMDESEKMPSEIDQLRDLIKEKKILFTIASGREYTQVSDLEKRLDIRLPIIICNGTAARTGSKFIWCDSIPNEVVLEICREADAMDMSVVLSLPDNEYAIRKTPFVLETIETYGRFGNILPLEELKKGKAKVQKILVIEKKREDICRKMAAFLKNYEDRLCVVDYGMSFDIVPKGCTKASGMHRLLKLLNIPIEEVMAVGDSYNDLEMLESAKVGVAVNNAAEALKKRADYVCEGRYILGVIEAIERFC